MTPYTDQDFEDFQEAAKEMTALVRAAHYAPRVKQQICADMDDIVTRLYAKRVNRLMADFVAGAGEKKPSLKRKLTLKDLALHKVPE